MGRLATWPSRILTLMASMNTTASRVQRTALPFRHTLHHPVGDRGDRLLRDFRAVDLGQVRGDLPVRHGRFKIVLVILGCWSGPQPPCLPGRQGEVARAKRLSWR